MEYYSAKHYSLKAKKSEETATQQADIAIEAVRSLDGKTLGIATSEEAVLGTNNTKAMTPFTTKLVVGNVKDDVEYLKDKVNGLELYKFPNATIRGEPIIQSGQVSGFSTTSYLQFPSILDFHDKAFQIDFCFTTEANVQTQQNILDSNFGIALAIESGKGLMAVSSNGTSWDIGVSVGTIDIQSNTTYYARLVWNKLQYKTFLSTDGVNYTQDMVLTGAIRPYPRTIFIGGCNQLETGHAPHPFLGTINFNKCYVTFLDTMQVIWQGMDDVGLESRADKSLSNLDSLGEEKINSTKNRNLNGVSPIKLWQGTQEEFDNGGQDGFFNWKTDAIIGNWVKTTNRCPNINIIGYAYGNGVFVLPEYVGSGEIYYSTDMVNFQSSPSGANLYFYSVAFGNNKFVAVGISYSFSDTSSYVYSTDGINWSVGNLPSSRKWLSVEYFKGKFIVLNDTAEYYAISEDGINWTELSTGIRSGVQMPNVVKGCSNGDKLIIPLQRDYDTYTFCFDGSQWSYTRFTASFLGITYGNGLFVAVGSPQSYNPREYYSTDGLNWSTGIHPSGYSVAPRSVVFINGVFIACSSGTGYYNCDSVYSTDGINWSILAPQPNSPSAWVLFKLNNDVYSLMSGEIISKLSVSSAEVFTDTETPTTESKTYSAPGIEYVAMNFDPFGNLTISDDFVASNFSTSNYIQLDDKYKKMNYTYIVKFKTPTSLSQGGEVMHSDQFLACGITDEGKLVTWNFGSFYLTTLLSLSPDTWYFLKVKTLNKYKEFSYSSDGESWQVLNTQYDSAMNESSPYHFRIGLSSTSFDSPFPGMIDVKEIYVLDENENIVFKGASAQKITSASTENIVLTNEKTYNRNAEGDITSSHSVGELHPDYLSVITDTGKIYFGNNLVAQK